MHLQKKRGNYVMKLQQKIAETNIVSSKKFKERFIIVALEIVCPV